MEYHRFVLAALVLALAACGEGQAPPAAPTKATAPGATPAKAADPAQVALSGDLAALVKLGPLPLMDVAETLRIAGRLEVNGYKTARIGAPVTGRIGDIRAVTGQEVRQGETLADISSQEVTTAQLAFLKAHSAEQLNSRAVERAELLLSADVIGSAELQRRQNELSVARAEKRAAADQLRVLGLSGKAVEQLEATGRLATAAPITATQAGTVIERKIAVGQVVQPSDSLFVVSDLRSVWAIAEVPEQDADAVSRGQRVEIEVPALGNETRVGKIVFVADVVNPETRTVRVGVDLDNPGKTLKPAMLITMLIERKVANRTVVPAAAVVRENDLDHLFLQTAPGVVRLTRARLGPEKSGMRAVLEALPAHQAVVLDGAFHLNNERLKRALEKGAALRAGQADAS
ncbi:MAG: efflux RND transporter periplasmic adaptor subunit [Burkholderiales bacterium]|nr:efflux RND transporter periplasmic adaptor subunit [Burkholderiales bacterium]